MKIFFLQKNQMNNLLLDVDGVIVRDNVLLNHVKSNIVKYVSKKLPGMKRHENINNLLYKAYGHTGLGLQAEFDIDTRDFNNYVYNKYLIAHLHDYLLVNENFNRDKRILREICDSHKVSFFSNAPLNWTEPIREAIDLRITNTFDNIKPNIDSYTKFGTDEEFIFVDDKMENLKPTIFLPNWTPIHYTDKPESQYIRNIQDLSVLCSKS